MRIDCTGSTRVVIILRKAVIKVPYITRGWRSLLAGLIANIDESSTWRYNSGKYEQGNSNLLCPVLWTSYGGWVLIMEKAKPMTWQEFSSPPGWTDPWLAQFPGDDSPSNYGFIEGRRVKIDYGNLNYSIKKITNAD